MSEDEYHVDTTGSENLKKFNQKLQTTTFASIKKRQEIGSFLYDEWKITEIMGQPPFEAITLENDADPGFTVWLKSNGCGDMHQWNVARDENVIHFCNGLDDLIKQLQAINDVVKAYWPDGYNKDY